MNRTVRFWSPSRWAPMVSVAATCFALGWIAHAPDERPKNNRAGASEPTLRTAANAVPGTASTTTLNQQLPSAPALDPSWDVPQLRIQYSRLAREYSAQTHELNLLREPNKNSVSVTEVPKSASPGKKSALEETFYPVTPDELDRLHKDCMVRTDQPVVMDSVPAKTGVKAEGMHATPEELHVMDEAMAALHHSFRDRLRRLYAEAVGHPPDTELSPGSLFQELRDKGGSTERNDLLDRIGRERAGELKPPTNLDAASPYERSERTFYGLGDEFQELVAAELGPERASELRSAKGGWPWLRQVAVGCAR